MTKVKPLRPENLSPEMVLQNILEQEAKGFRSVFVIGIKEDGTTSTWSSADLSDLTHASLVLQDLAFKYLNGYLGKEE